MIRSLFAFALLCVPALAEVPTQQQIESAYNAMDSAIQNATWYANDAKAKVEHAAGEASDPIWGQFTPDQYETLSGLGIRVWVDSSNPGKTAIWCQSVTLWQVETYIYAGMFEEAEREWTHANNLAQIVEDQLIDVHDKWLTLKAYWDLWWTP